MKSIYIIHVWLSFDRRPLILHHSKLTDQFNILLCSTDDFRETTAHTSQKSNGSPCWTISFSFEAALGSQLWSSQHRLVPLDTAASPTPSSSSTNLSRCLPRKRSPVVNRGWWVSESSAVYLLLTHTIHTLRVLPLTPCSPKYSPN